VVLFVHGGSFPGVPGFDLPYRDYSWMAYLAAEGFDAYALDLTGYGRSSRPHMDDPRNILPAQQQLIGMAPASASFPHRATSLASDEADIDAVVEFIRARTGAAKVHLIGWSGGGPRVTAYAARHADKVARVMFFAPAYLPDASAFIWPDQSGAPMSIATRETSMARWDQSIRHADQYDPAIRDAMWRANLEMDPVGAAWGPGVVRYPTSIDCYVVPPDLARRFTAPVLMIAGELDAEVPPAMVRGLYDAVGSDSKVMVTVEGASHFAVFERTHMILLEASRDWLRTGRYAGAGRGLYRASREGRVAPAE
jgi:pimeloyl-ACP methyl ester carboxylesterase